MSIWVYAEKNKDGRLTKEGAKLWKFAESIRQGKDSLLRDIGDLSAEEIVDYAKKKSPEVILFTSGEKAKALAGTLAVELDAAVVSNCFGIKQIDGNGKIHWIRPVFDNSLLAEMTCSAHTQIAIMRITTQNPSAAWRKDLPIDDAEIIVCVGRGCGNGPGMELAIEFAKTIGAAVGTTRAVTDEGWLPISKQIGQTGKYVRPRIYIGVGVAGAIQHLAGMRNSDIIIAINKDERAPIFEHADYGIVGDLYTVLPIMIEAFSSEEGAAAFVRRPQPF